MNNITFAKGRCLECDVPIPANQILCQAHYFPSQDLVLAVREVKISEMQEGDTGFTEEYAVFEIDGKLLLIGTARVSSQSEGYKTMKITVKHGAFEIDRTTIDPDDIYLGWPDMNDQPDCFQAKLV